eukprot:11203653-Lingulodinium_polyedra.AAC.1
MQAMSGGLSARRAPSMAPPAYFVSSQAAPVAQRSSGAGATGRSRALAMDAGPPGTCASGARPWGRIPGWPGARRAGLS